MMSIITAVFFLSFTTVFAEEQKPQPKWMSTPTKDLVDKASASVKKVNIQDVKKAIDSKEDVVILDVRDPDEYGAAHIPGAVNISRGLLEFSIWSVVTDKNAKIYVYCKTGARAALATKQLNEFGYKNAMSVDTGVIAWIKAGYPVQTSIADNELVLIPAVK